MASHANSTPVPAAHRAGFPLPIIEPDARRRLEAVVERLGAYHDRFARHVRRATAAMDRIERLRQSAIGALDVIDGDADLEPTLCHPGAMGSDHLDGLEDDRSDFEPDSDDEPSLCGKIGLPDQGHAVGAGSSSDLEDQCEDEGAYDGDNDTSDDEPSLCGIHMALSGGVGVYRDGKMHYDLEADGDEQ